jgi:hypothetical protein
MSQTRPTEESGITPLSPETVEQNGRSSRPKFLLMFVILVVLVTVAGVGGVWIFNQTSLEKPLQRVLTADPRNRVVHATAHFDGWIDTTIVVFNLTKVDGESTQIDVFRTLLQFAREQKDHSYERVILAAYGKKKFVLSGEYFQQLGRAYDSENPVYTIRTFAHHLSTMAGEQPFAEPTGGLFWILKEETDQFTQFNKRWYLDDFVSREK